MKTVIAVVERKTVGNAVQSEPAARNAVGKAADDGAKVRLVGFIAGERVVAEHHVGQLPGSVGNLEGDNGAAVVGDVGLQAALAGKSVESCPPSIAGCTERFARHSPYFRRCRWRGR